MFIILYSAIAIFIIIIIVITIINKTKYFMTINSANILTSDGRISMYADYEPKLNDITTLKNVLNIKKGLYEIHKSFYTQKPLNLGDTVNFENNTSPNINIIRPSDNKISVSYDNNKNTFTITNDSDMINYIKITYVPPSLSGTDAICKFNIYVNNVIVNTTPTVYRTGTSTTQITNVPIGIYIMKSLPNTINIMDIRIVEISGTDLHLGYEGYVVIEEL
jgi:hypothetical protein